MNTYEWAKKYIEIGWSVIPVNENKIPTIPEVIPYRTRYATDEELHKWFDNGLWGIAVLTGSLSRVMVIDDDSVKKTGVEVNTVSKMRSSVLSQTGGGGKHFFLKYEDGIGNKVNINGKHIDVRTEGGYVVVPPSKWGLREYTWLSAPTNENLEIMPSLSATPEIETELKYKTNSILKINDYLFLGKGNRNDGLFRLTCSLLHRVKKEEAYDMMKGIAKNYDPPLLDSESETIFKQALKYYEEDKKIRTKQPKKTSEIAQQRLKERETEGASPTTGYYTLDCLIGGFVPGNLYCLTGETNAGKTTVACNFAINVSNQGKKVLYIALETGNKVVETLASIRIKKTYSDLTDKDILTPDDNIDLFVDRDITSIGELKETIKNLESRYDLIIIDHIGYFVTDKSNYLQEQANILKELRFITKESNTAIMIIAHLRKRMAMQKKDYIPTGDDISGSASFKQDSTDVLIVIRKKDELDPHNLKYTNAGFIYVTKTKGRSTGAIDIKFHDDIYDRSALVEEVMTV